MDKIDSLDLKILKVLTADARVPLKELADTCGMSRAAVHQRIMRLTEAGVLAGSGYHLNPKLIGYNTCTYVGITLERGSMYRTVAARLEQIPEIVECHFTTGAYTMLVKLYSHDNAHLMELLNEGIQGIEGVTSTETLISLEQTIHREIPIAALPDTGAEPRKEKRGRKPKKTKAAP
ncbi:MAG: Lrp/AsnC ligand binding domain-containing protein [Alloprevotella sp.]|nr:Lrp/AsnC ligand binding domain-containing protein [Alloprevotella sp.]